VSLDVQLADRIMDLVYEGFDLAVRIARLPDSTLVSRKLASTRLVLCASPKYLRAKGAPRHPNELGDHDVIGYSLLAMGDQWQFIGPDGPLTWIRERQPEHRPAHQFAMDTTSGLRRREGSAIPPTLSADHLATHRRAAERTHLFGE